MTRSLSDDDGATNNNASHFLELEKRDASAEMPALYHHTLWRPSDDMALPRRAPLALVPPPAMLLRVEHNLVFGRDVIQVPLKVPDRNNEYVNLVLSHREFDVMAVHIPQYDVMQPSDLVEEITRLVKEQAEKHKAKRHVLGVSNQSGDLDTTAIFQARILELEYEVSRLNTKLAASRALQSTLTEENALLRSNLGDLERRSGDMDDWRQEREQLKAEAAVAQAESARLSALLQHSHHRIQEISQDMEALRNQATSNKAEVAAITETTMQQVLSVALMRERVLQQSYFDEKKERQVMAEKFFEISGRIRHKSKHVPYRNSKLTFMLREMLSGNAKTLMMLQLSPDDGDVEETLCSLQFGARVSQIQMGAVRASVESGEIIKLKERNQTLERELAKWRDATRGRDEELEEARERNKQLEKALDQKEKSLYDQVKSMKPEEESTLSDDSASSVSGASQWRLSAFGTAYAVVIRDGVVAVRNAHQVGNPSTDSGEAYRYTQSSNLGVDP
ncbi:hypothetical protein ATCC90586_008587 [Pythium insidiosum]|nr:hypothetical protein ATCC90586_008587 [Pythium insidiosum]